MFFLAANLTSSHGSPWTQLCGDVHVISFHAIRLDYNVLVSDQISGQLGKGTERYDIRITKSEDKSLRSMMLFYPWSYPEILLLV
jgi:hypothetical protein